MSINDIRLGRRDKILELMRSLKAWEENRGRAPLTIRASTGKVLNGVH